MQNINCRHVVWGAKPARMDINLRHRPRPIILVNETWGNLCTLGSPNLTQDLDATIYLYVCIYTCVHTVADLLYYKNILFIK